MTLWTDGMNRAVLSWELTARNILIDTRTDYYDKDGKAVRFSQTRDDVTLTYLFDDNENIIYIPERGADNSYAYYYYQDGNLICYSKNMTRNYEPFDDAVKSSSNESFQNGQSLLADRLISKEGSKPDDEKEDEDEKNQSDQGLYSPGQQFQDSFGQRSERTFKGGAETGQK